MYMYIYMYIYMHMCMYMDCENKPSCVLNGGAYQGVCECLYVCV